LADAPGEVPESAPRELTPQDITPHDHAAAVVALRAARKQLAQAGREWSELLAQDVCELLAQLRRECEVVRLGDYLLAYRITGGWFMPTARFFEEVLVLRIYREHGNHLRSVAQEMERIARARGCAGMHVGTWGDSTGRLAKAYQRLGFKPAPAQLYKEF